MKKTALLFFGACALFTVGCRKSSNNKATTTITETEVITDFVNKVGLPQYQDLQDKAMALNTAVTTLNAVSTDANLEAARTAWRNVRSCWENCEGFLVGPVEDDNYDPNMDTWPVDYLQLDSFINTSTSFSTAAVSGLSQSLRGFHPLEFILWGQNGQANAASISAKEKQYMVALSEDILSNVKALNNSWSASGGNFQAQFINAGTSSSTRFPTRLEAFIALVDGMSGICGEVGDGKMKEPFDALDSTKTESPFSHNSITDFTNNIKGAQNVYLCTYNSHTGSGLTAFVSAKNLSLDTKIKQQFEAAVTALGNVTVNFEVAIYTQRTQLQNAMDAINILQGTLDGELKTFVQANVKD